MLDISVDTKRHFADLRISKKHVRSKCVKQIIQVLSFTPPKTNMETKHDGFKNVSPASNMAILGIQC